jgi:predicted RNA binding protein YcfA (HicA-like mRNA interferase family)
MSDYGKKVRELLSANGYVFHHHGKGDHDIWSKPDGSNKVTVDGKIKSRHTANQIMKDAGIEYRF